jgi:hypothetical protein
MSKVGVVGTFGGFRTSEAGMMNCSAAHLAKAEENRPELRKAVCTFSAQVRVAKL